MGNNYDIILIGLVAVFLILRLRSVLGKRTGNERPPARDPFTPPAPPPASPRLGDAPAPGQSGNDNILPLPNGGTPPRPPLSTAGPGGIRATVVPAAAAGVAAIRSADPSFDAGGFTAGARAAFTTIVEAFAKGDTAALRPLLDNPTFASFEGAIRGRAERKEKAETTLIGFEASDIASAELSSGGDANVTVRFVSEQINVLRNAEGQIVDGNPNEVQKVVDLWTFRRDTKSSDPNWQLVKTESEG
ncbi:MAG: Tim44 domain-containing protein [Alphaproteobacteria bacterium]|nr:Tim44 domain-containing protein [Alphaproteobacteria bacterium]MBV8408356.1 Tim44 domain-containing protein [Alphaproteobacteria bacterium]